MLTLGNLFPIYLNIIMTKKKLDLEIVDKSFENEILLKVNNIEIPSIVNCSFNIKKQYFLVVFPVDFKLEKISVYIFKKKYDETKKNYIYNIGNCKKNFIINFSKKTENQKNWKNIISKTIVMQDMIINFLEEHNIRSEDYTSYRSLYYGNKNKEFFVEDIWGEETTEFNIDWIITLESIIKKNYGWDFLDYVPKYDSFIRSSIKRIYYPYCLNNCPIYQFICESCIFKCDNCLKFFDKNQNEKDIWHNYNFGDLCNFCYQKIKSQYFQKIKKNWKISLQVAKKKIFQIELKKTIRFLHQKKILNLNIEKKNLLYENIIKAINSNSQREHCSICLDILDNNLSTGSCGHCFHTNCIKMISDNKCPVCRQKTDYIKLHL